MSDGYNFDRGFPIPRKSNPRWVTISRDRESDGLAPLIPTTTMAKPITCHHRDASMRWIPKGAKNVPWPRVPQVQKSWIHSERPAGRPSNPGLGRNLTPNAGLARPSVLGEPPQGPHWKGYSHQPASADFSRDYYVPYNPAVMAEVPYLPARSYNKER